MPYLTLLKTLKKYWLYVVIAIALIVAYFALKDDDNLNELFTSKTLEKGGEEISNKEFDTLTKDVVRLAKALGTMPGHWSLDEYDEEAFQIISDWRHYKQHTTTIYENITGRDYISDLINLLDNEYLTQLRKWHYL